MLPKNVFPIYETKLFSNKKVNYRPFFASEEKALKIAFEMGHENDSILTAKKIIDNCTFNKLDIDHLPVFDLEYLYLLIHSKSVGEISKISIECNNCQNVIPYGIDLSKVTVKQENVIDSVIELLPKIGIKLKYPTIDIINKYDTINNILDDELVVDCIEYVFNDEEIIKPNEVKREDLIDWIQKLTGKQYSLIEKFFLNLPQLSHDINLECKNCKSQYNHTLKGLLNFFQ